MCLKIGKSGLAQETRINTRAPVGANNDQQCSGPPLMGLYQMVMKAQEGRAVPVLNAHLVAKTCFLMERERVQPLAFGLEDWFPNGNRVFPATGFLNEILCGKLTVHKQTNKQTKQEKFEKMWKCMAAKHF